MILSSPLFAAPSIIDCASMIETKWSGKVFDANTGAFLQDLHIEFFGMSDSINFNGRYTYSGRGFTSCDCAEYTGVVRSISCDFVINGEVVNLWSDYPSPGYLGLTNATTIRGYLIRAR